MPDPIPMGDEVNAWVRQTYGPDSVGWRVVLPKAPMHDAWISVKDRLPDRGVPVLIYRPNCRYTGLMMGSRMGCDDWHAGSVVPKHTVTHWRPLPDPPKEGE